jgi:Rhodopirellula transposase DDE domain
MFHTLGMDKTVIQTKWDVLSPMLDERGRRLWAAAESESLGWGGITLVSEVTGLSRQTIHAGLGEIHAMANGDSSMTAKEGRMRTEGGGRKSLTESDPTLAHDLDLLVDPATRGNPMSPLRWTSKSTEHLAEALRQQGHKVSHKTVARMLTVQGYSLQANRKSKESEILPDRDKQFAHINTEAKAFQQDGQPVISVDTKKKELVGEYKNGGQEWQPVGEPEHVLDHDFPKKGESKAVPYGIYDVAANLGWVSVGNDHDTPEFAVHAIRTWWQQMGQPMYPQATRLLVTADCGGSNGYRARAWKMNLQKLANETDLTITVCHFPPGTSKWNKIEHRMFCHITQNWRGRPLVSLETIVSLIGAVTTRKGLRIRAKLDPGKYEVGIKVTDKEMAEVRIVESQFQGAWNYSILPKAK